MGPFSSRGGPADLSPEARRNRLVLGIPLVAILVLSLVWLQDLFDAGDRRRALAALETTRGVQGGSESLARLLRRAGGGALPRCDAQVISGFRGVTRLECRVAGDLAPWIFLWDDVKRDGLRAADDATRARLAAIPPPRP